MGSSDLPSDITLEWNRIINPSGWIGLLGSFEDIQSSQNTSQLSQTFPPPHAFQVGANSQGSLDPYSTGPEIPSTHYRTTISVASHHRDWEGSFLPDHAHLQTTTGPPAYSTTLGTTVHDGGNWTSNSAGQFQHQGPPAIPPSDVNPEGTGPVILPIETPPALSPVSPFPSHWVKIPQYEYDYGRRQQNFEPSNPIFFGTRDYPGINIQDALNKNFTRLINPSERVLGHATAILCRFQFLGYPVGGRSCQKVQTLNTASNRRAISRGKLAHEIAKKLKRYLDAMIRITPDESVEGRWKIGDRFMRIENMFLVGFVSVSKGSYQPEIWVADPSVPQVRADRG